MLTIGWLSSVAQRIEPLLHVYTRVKRGNPEREVMRDASNVARVTSAEYDLSAQRRIGRPVLEALPLTVSHAIPLCSSKQGALSRGGALCSAIRLDKP